MRKGRGTILWLATGFLVGLVVSGILFAFLSGYRRWGRGVDSSVPTSFSVSTTQRGEDSPILPNVSSSSEESIPTGDELPKEPVALSEREPVSPDEEAGRDDEGAGRDVETKLDDSPISPEFQSEMETLRERIVGTSPSDCLMDSPDWIDLLPVLNEKAVSPEEKELFATVESEAVKLLNQIDAFRNRTVRDGIDRLTFTASELRKDRKWSEETGNRWEETDGEWEKLASIKVTEDSLRLLREEKWKEWTLLYEEWKRLSPLFNRLDRFDPVSSQPEEVVSFLTETAALYPGTPYEADFRGAISSYDSVPLISRWNDWITRYGVELAHFAVPSETALSVTEFYADNLEELTLIPEWDAFRNRVRVLSVTARDIPFHQKIHDLMVNHQKDYPILIRGDQWFYLLEPPKVGENRYRSDLFGNVKKVVLTEEDLGKVHQSEIASIFAEWIQMVDQIPDDLRLTDPALWFFRWGDVLKSVKTREEIDPLLRFYLLRDMVAVLSSGDYYFQKRLSAWDRYLNAPTMEGFVDYFDAESAEVADRRKRGRELLLFAPNDILLVDKSTADLDRMIPDLFWTYRLVGWLDQDLDGVWFFRMAPSLTAERKSHSGRLFLFLRHSGGDGIDGGKKFDAVEIGTMSDGVGEINLISSGLRRGLPVFCRERFSRPESEIVSFSLGTKLAR